MATASDPVVILSAARTPLGRFMGELSPLSAHKLGTHVIGAALERAALAPERIDEVFMGNVLPAGQGQAPARQAARGAKLPDATGATTINKVCGSGMKATMLAHDIIHAGSASIVLSGGMESMSNAPYLLAKARGGYRAGHDQIIDHMMMDGLEDAYDAGRLLRQCRWRRGAHSRKALTRGSRRPPRTGRDQGPRDPQPGTAMVHHGADPGHSQAIGQGRLERRRCRSVRDQRGLCQSGDGGAEASRHPQGAAERQWRRLRARSSHWRHGRAPDRNFVACARSPKPQTRRCSPLHRWR